MMTFCKVNTVYILVSVALALSSCTQKKDVANGHIPLEVAIGLQKTMCYGSCPSFNFSVLNDGQATLTVGRFAEKAFGRTLEEGKYIGTIELHEIAKIKNDEFSCFKINCLTPSIPIEHTSKPSSQKAQGESIKMLDR